MAKKLDFLGPGGSQLGKFGSIDLQNWPKIAIFWPFLAQKFRKMAYFYIVGSSKVTINHKETTGDRWTYSDVYITPRAWPNPMCFWAKNGHKSVIFGHFEGFWRVKIVHVRAPGVQKVVCFAIL